MAYVYNSGKEEEEQQQGAKQIAGTDSGAPTSAGKTGASAKPQYTSPNQKGMSPFTDVQAYLNANRDQSMGIANKITPSLSASGQEAQGLANQTLTDYEQNVNQNTIRPESGEVNKVIENPVEYAKNQQQADLFKNMSTGNYTGNKTIEDTSNYQTAYDKAQEANRRMGLINTREGRDELLKSIQKNKAQGITSLNDLLLGQSKEAVGAVKDEASKFGDINAYLSGKKNEAADFGSQAEKDRAKTQQEIQNKILGEQGALAGIKADANKTLAEKQKMIEALQTGDYKALGKDGLKALGISDTYADQIIKDRLNTQQLAEHLKNAYTGDNPSEVNISPESFSLKDYETLNPDAINEASVLSNAFTPEQAARYNALTSLTGQENEFAAPKNISTLGSFNSEAYNQDQYNKINNLYNYRQYLSPEDQKIVEELWRNANQAKGQPTRQLERKMYNNITINNPLPSQGTLPTA